MRNIFTNDDVGCKIPAVKSRCHHFVVIKTRHWWQLSVP